MLNQVSVPRFECRTLPTGEISGYGSVFDVADSYGDVVVPGAFAKSLAAGLPAFLWSHDQSRPVGRWVEAKEDARGLFLRGQLNTATEAGREALAHVAGGDVTGLSIGFLIPQGGATQRGDHRELREVTLAEVSLVTLPANPAARITSVKSAGGRPATVRELETALRDLGFSRREAAGIAKRGFGGIDDEADPSLELHDAIAAIRAVTAQLHSLKG